MMFKIYIINKIRQITFQSFYLRNFLKPIILTVIVIIFVIVFVIALFVQFSSNKTNLTYNDLLKLNDSDFISINIGTFKINAEIARSNQKKEQGLSGKQKLKDNEGMLFIFDQEGYYSFWMKGMLFNIDIIFIKDNNIIDIAKNMPYPIDENNIAQVVPKEKANLVLEINAGLVEKYNIKIGDTINFFYRGPTFKGRP